MWLGCFASALGTCCVPCAHHAEMLTQNEYCVLRAPTRCHNQYPARVGGMQSLPALPEQKGASCFSV